MPSGILLEAQERECADCGTTFLRTHSRKTRCAACQRKAPLRRTQAWRESDAGKEWTAKTVVVRREHAAAWRAANLERARELARQSQRRRKYGLSPKAYLDMFKAQEFKCAICAAPIAPHTTNAHVDHCHATGRVRGLLCATCNRELVALERPGWLESALTYLKRGESDVR